MNTSPDNATPDTNIDHETVRLARALHEHACKHIDPATRARLAAARREALAATKHRPRRLIWLPAAGAAAACALVVGLVWFKPQSGGPAAPAAITAGGDTELSLGADARELDLYQNLDFYQWLAQQPQSRSRMHGDRQ